MAGTAFGGFQPTEPDIDVRIKAVDMDEGSPD